METVGYEIFALYSVHYNFGSIRTCPQAHYRGDPLSSSVLMHMSSNFNLEWETEKQRDSDGSGQPRASPMLTAIMSGGVGISGRELYKYR